jgi:UTP-glucose-1-phosphate uridylyltransferase
MEKPEKPPTNLAIMPIYVFHPVIFKALEKTLPGKGGEVQLTDAIQKLIEWGLNVYAVKLNQDQVRLDIGSPETYLGSLVSILSTLLQKN